MKKIFLLSTLLLSVNSFSIDVTMDNIQGQYKSEVNEVPGLLSMLAEEIVTDYHFKAGGKLSYVQTHYKGGREADKLDCSGSYKITNSRKLVMETICDAPLIGDLENTIEIDLTQFTLEDITGGQSKSIESIITDSNVPGVSGTTLVAKLKKN